VLVEVLELAQQVLTEILVVEWAETNLALRSALGPAGQEEHPQSP